MNEKIMPEILIKNETKNLIYEIRGTYVMLDSDVASAFNVDTSQLNRQMKRNISRFPEDFCFQLNSKEFKNLRCQNGTFKLATKGRKYCPILYTEYGIIALAGVLKSEVAAKASVEISRKFIEMRKTLLSNSYLLQKISGTESELLEFKDQTNRKFEELYRWKDSKDIPLEKVFYEGEVYDAFEHIVRIIRSANESIVLVDSYVDVTSFIYLNHKNSDVKITIYKGAHSRLTEEETSIFEAQNGQIKVCCKTPLHDRYLIIDQNNVFILGGSLNRTAKNFLIIARIKTDKVKEQIIEEYPL